MGRHKYPLVDKRMPSKTLSFCLSSIKSQKAIEMVKKAIHKITKLKIIKYPTEYLSFVISSYTFVIS